MYISVGDAKSRFKVHSHWIRFIIAFETNTFALHRYYMSQKINVTFYDA